MSDEFEQQLALEKAEKERQQPGSDPYTYVDPNDGTVYEWDHGKSAWFPKVTEDFLAAYQANYGAPVETPAQGSGDASSSGQQPSVSEKPAAGSQNSPEQQMKPSRPNRNRANQVREHSALPTEP